MNLALWIIAGLLAAVFPVGGASKLIVAKERLAAFPGGGWVEDFSGGAVKALGVLDVLAAMGLILPAALDIAPILVPLAAVGVALLMVGAVITRIRSHMAVTIVPDLIYLALAVFVASGRFGSESSTGRPARCLVDVEHTLARDASRAVVRRADRRSLERLAEQLARA